MSLDALIAHVEAECPALQSVQRAFEMAPVDDLEQETPAAFLFPMQDNAGADGGDNYVVQNVTTDYAIFIVGPFDSLESLRAEIRTALLGWQATQYHQAMTYVSGQAEDIKGDYLWWREVYRTSVHIRSA